jgi:hypothetical protein
MERPQAVAVDRLQLEDAMLDGDTRDGLGGRMAVRIEAHGASPSAGRDDTSVR